MIIKIIEGMADDIEQFAEDNKDDYRLETINLSHRARVYVDDKGGEVSDETYSFYYAVFRKRRS